MLPIHKTSRSNHEMQFRLFHNELSTVPLIDESKSKSNSEEYEHIVKSYISPPIPPTQAPKDCQTASPLQARNDDVKERVPATVPQVTVESLCNFQYRFHSGTFRGNLHICERSANRTSSLADGPSVARYFFACRSSFC